MSSRLSFFATLDEELEWFSRVIISDVDWCVAEEVVPEHRAIQLRDSEVISHLRSAEPGEMRLFLGRSSLRAGPVWRQSAVRNEIDAIRSMAIHFVPSFSVGDVLVEGRMDILDAGAYLRAGLDPVPLQRWYTDLQASFRRALKADSVALTPATGESDNRRSSRLFSPGAIRWFKQGGELKQFLEGKVAVSPPASLLR